MLPVVLIDIGPPNAQPSYAGALAAACSQAVARGRCQLSGSQQKERADAIAIVSWQGSDQSNVQVQVGTRRSGKTQWLSRRMHFSPADAPIERWRAVGLTVATLVGELPPPPKSRVEPARMPAPAPAPAPKPLWLDVAAVAGPGLDAGAWRVGGRLGAAYALPHFPAFVGGSLGYAVRSKDARGISVGFLTLSAVGGTALRPSTFPVEVDAAAGLELQQVRAGVDQGGRSDSGSRWVPGLDGRVLALYPARGSLAVFAGLVGWVQTNPTELSLHDARVERVPPAGFCLELGLRARLP